MRRWTIDPGRGDGALEKHSLRQVTELERWLEKESGNSHREKVNMMDGTPITHPHSSPPTISLCLFLSPHPLFF